MRELPAIEVLTNALAYDPATGILTFKPRENVRGCWNARHAGKRALSTLGPDGYFRGYLFGKMTLAHRIAFAIHTGRTDFAFIDHVSGDRSDNRACNLREVSRTDNAKNKARPTNSTSGHIGVSRTYDGKWRAHITLDGRLRHLGRFTTIQEAIEARASAEEALGFHPNHGRTIESAA